MGNSNSEMSDNPSAKELVLSENESFKAGDGNGSAAELAKLQDEERRKEHSAAVVRGLLNAKIEGSAPLPLQLPVSVEDAEWRKEKFDSATQDLLKKENIDRQQEQENIKGHDKKVHNSNSNGGHKDFASKVCDCLWKCIA